MWELSPKRGLNEYLTVYVCLQLKFSAEGSSDWIGSGNSVELPSLLLLLCDASVCPRPQLKVMALPGYWKDPKLGNSDGKEDCNYGRWFFYQVHRLNSSSWQLSSTEALITYWKLWNTYYVPGIVMDTGMVLWIWPSHSPQKTPHQWDIGKR